MKIRGKVDVTSEQLSDESYISMLVELLRKAYTNVSAMNTKKNVIFTFHEEYSPKELIYAVTVLFRTPDMEEGKAAGLQEVRVKAESKIPSHLRKARRSCFEHLFILHMDTSLIHWMTMAKMLKDDPEFQKRVKDSYNEPNGEQEDK